MLHAITEKNKCNTYKRNLSLEHETYVGLVGVVIIILS